MSGAGDLDRTPLHDEHQRLGGRLVPFGGFEMPVQYAAGIVAEHQAVRQAAGLFDVSHMGELVVRGPDALTLLQRLTTNDVARLDVGQAQYTVLCDDDGGALDDCLLYRFGDRYMLVVNASNRERDLAWILDHDESLDVAVDDRSAEIALIALQGPQAQAILARVCGIGLDEIGYYRFTEGDVAGRGATISRTGYTGEDGFELYLDAADAAHVWDALLASGGPDGLLPAGLGARDSLRLEMGYILYGNDLDQDHTPLEAGLGWVVKLGKGDFIGSSALRSQKEKGLERRLVGLRLLERGFPRSGYAVRVNGEEAATVTSGVYGPSVECGIGLAYLPAASREPDASVEVVIRDRAVPAEVVRPPFYAEGSLRR